MAKKLVNLNIESVEIQLQIILFLLKWHSQFPPTQKKKCIPKGYNFTHTLTPKQSNKFSPQSNNIELVECNVEERKEAVKDLKQDPFYYKRVVPIFFSPVKNKRKL